ncbi:hypothetical protein GALL_386460 [mine drainage metagenome]|uniref:Sulfite:cytochrome c oxidoreductase subunit B n=1 Tax=mine drainage metagenome TaxID=410659 RepID=A0A1J5QQ45_9ZZZZ
MNFRSITAAVVLALSSPACVFADESRVQLAAGSGGDAVSANCVMCHSLDYIQMNSPFLDEKGWTAEVHKMVKAYGAPIKEEDQTVIIAYLVKQYGKN